MGDPIIIWLPGTVLDYAGACDQFTTEHFNGLHSGACAVEDDGNGGVYVSCCVEGG